MLLGSNLGAMVAAGSCRGAGRKGPGAVSQRRALLAMAMERSGGCAAAPAAPTPAPTPALAACRRPGGRHRRRGRCWAEGPSPGHQLWRQEGPPAACGRASSSPPPVARRYRPAAAIEPLRRGPPGCHKPGPPAPCAGCRLPAPALAGLLPSSRQHLLSIPAPLSPTPAPQGIMQASHVRRAAVQAPPFATRTPLAWGRGRARGQGARRPRRRSGGKRDNICTACWEKFGFELDLLPHQQNAPHRRRGGRLRTQCITLSFEPCPAVTRERGDCAALPIFRF